MDYLWGTPVQISNLRPGFSDFEDATRMMKEALPQNGDYNLHNVWDIPEFQHLKALFHSEIQKFTNAIAIEDSFCFFDAYVVHSVETNLSTDPNPRITVSADLYSKRLTDYLKTK